MFRGVSEFKGSLPKTQCPDDGAMGDATQREYQRSLLKGLQFVGEENVAGIDFRADRFVVRWKTFNGVRDPAIEQSQIVFG